MNATLVFGQLLLVIITLQLVVSMRKSQSGLPYTKSNFELTCIGVVAMTLIVVASLRHFDVGIDINAYSVRFYAQALDRMSWSFNWLDESGFRILEYIIFSLTGEYRFFLFIIAVAYVGSVSLLIARYSMSPMLSFVFFITMGYYTFSLSALRQTIALAIIMLAVQHIAKRRLGSFLLTVLFAALFHLSAIVFLPAYFFGSRKLTFRDLAIISALGFLWLFMAGNLTELVAPPLMTWVGRFATPTATGGWGLLSLIVFLIVMGMVYRVKLASTQSVNSIFFYLLFVALLVFPLARWNPVFFRLLHYFMITSIIYIPNLVISIKQREVRWAVLILVLGVTTFNFFWEIVPTNQLSFYRFFWQ